MKVEEDGGEACQKKFFDSTESEETPSPKEEAKRKRSAENLAGGPIPIL